jgi:hypothetical protein
VEQALPDALYQELEATFPEQWMLERIQRLDAGSPTRRLKVAEALQWGDLAPIWVDFLRFHTSPDYLRDVVRLFEPQLVAALGSEQLHQLWQGSVTPRRIGPRGDLVTDCQFVLNEPVGAEATTQPAHVDNPKEIYAGLLYMRKPEDRAGGGDFTVHRLEQPIRRLDKARGRQLPSALHTPVRTIPYRPNTFCLFLNVFGAVHSVTPRLQPIERRRSINIIGEFAGRQRMWKRPEYDSRLSTSEQLRQRVWRRMRRLMGRGG